jgi:hypothetical protein
MQHLLAILLLAACAVSAQGQTIKTLGYNTTNGNVVYAGTNVLTFTNDVRFGGDDLTISGQVISGGGVSLSFEDGLLVGEILLETNSSIAFVGASAAITRTNLGLGLPALTNTNVTNFRTAIGLGATNDVEFNSMRFGNSGTFDSDGVLRWDGTNRIAFEERILEGGDWEIRGSLNIQQTAATNGLLFIYRTNNEPFLGLANLIALNNVTVSNETLFRVGVSEATNKAAQFGFRSTNTNGNGVAVFSVFGYNALMMIGPSDPAAGTNPIEAMVYSINPTNKVMTLIKTNTGAMLMHRPIGIDTAGVSTNAPANTTNVAGWIEFYVGTNSVRVPYYQ